MSEVADRPKDLASELRRYEKALAPAGSPLPQLLQPPASAARLDEAERELGLTFSNDIRTLYGWHDGSDCTDPRWMNAGATMGATGFLFPPLADAVAYYKRYQASKISDWFSPYWFTVMWGGDGPHSVSISCLTRESQEVLIGGHVDSHQFRIANLAILVAAYGHRLESGVWRWVDDVYDSWTRTDSASVDPNDPQTWKEWLGVPDATYEFFDHDDEAGPLDPYS